MEKQIVAIFLALCLATMPVCAINLAPKNNIPVSKSTSQKSTQSTPIVKVTGKLGEKYAIIGKDTIVLPPDNSEIPQPTITKNKSGKYICTYDINRQKTYNANDKAIIDIIDSWNAPSSKETIEVKTKTGTKKVTGSFNIDAAHKVFMSVNAKRLAEKLTPLSWSAALYDASKLRAAELTMNNSHTRPDGSDCFTAAKGMTGENIAFGYNTPEIAMKEWMSSPGHKENILRSTFDEMSSACFKTSSDIYWVQNFGGY